MPKNDCPRTNSGRHLPVFQGRVAHKGVWYRLYVCSACALEWSEEV
jgi:hypothetical protein